MNLRQTRQTLSEDADRSAPHLQPTSGLSVRKQGSIVQQVHEEEIEPYNLYHHFGPLAEFTRSVDWPGHRWAPVGLSRPNLPVSLNVYGLATDDRALVWIHDPLAFRIEAGKAVRGPRQQSASCNILGLADGPYEIEWFDTLAGVVLRRDSGSVNHLDHFGYGLELRPPGFWGDVAARIMRRGRRW